MANSVENILNEAMNLRPSERAVLAQRLISSLSANDDDIEAQWLELSKQRFEELKNNSVRQLSWEEIRTAVKKS